MAILNMVYGSGGGGGGDTRKSYAEITAMTLSNALTELNSQALGYYNKFTAEGKMIGDRYLSNATNKNLFLWGDYYVGYSNGSWSSTEIPDAEENILRVMMTDESGNLLVPFCPTRSTTTAFNFYVSYDGGTETEYSWVRDTTCIKKIGENLGANTKHLVRIRPKTALYNWAKYLIFFYAEGLSILKPAPLLTGIVVDGGYKGYAQNATTTGASYRLYQYCGCTNLENCSKEVLPNTVTSIGNEFRKYQYQYCSSLTTTATEVLPSSVTTIGTNFRAYQYEYCTSLTSAGAEVLPNSVTSIGNYFRFSQYSHCASLTTAPAEVLPSSISSVGDYFRRCQYQYCTSLTTAPAEVLPNSVTTIGSDFRCYQYQYCISLTTPPTEVLPNTVTSIGANFRSYQYYFCDSITASPTEALSSLITSIGNNFRANQYYYCISLTSAGAEALPDSVTSIGTYFRNNQYGYCTALSSVKGWKDLSIGGTNYRVNQFSGCSKAKTIKVLSNVGYAGQSNTLSNSYVTRVQVPSAYLQRFKSSTIYPRSSITDSKFVGY